MSRETPHRRGAGTRTRRGVVTARGLAVVFAVVFGVWTHAARAEEPTPLAEMRAAAEALADVDPQHPTPKEARAAVGNPAAPPGAARRSLVLAAVREEVEREVAARGGSERGAASSGKGKRPDKGPDKDQERGQGAAVSSAARGAAAQAQEARRNREVATERGQGNGKGPPVVPPGLAKSLGVGK